MKKRTDLPTHSDIEETVQENDEQMTEKLDDNPKPIPRGIHIDVLRKHFSLFGLPGVGKATSVINILLPLNKKKIPFMVIESARKEYRVLKRFKKHPNKATRKIAK